MHELFKRLYYDYEVIVDIGKTIGGFVASITAFINLIDSIFGTTIKKTIHENIKSNFKRIVTDRWNRYNKRNE